MEIYFRKFVNYLFEKVKVRKFLFLLQGIVSINSIHEFLNIYKQKIDNHYRGTILIETLQKIIYEYFENIDEETLYQLSKDIIIKYIENLDRIKIKSSQNLYKIYGRSQFRNFKEKFLIWKYKSKYTGSFL